MPGLSRLDFAMKKVETLGHGPKASPYPMHGPYGLFGLLKVACQGLCARPERLIVGVVGSNSDSRVMVGICGGWVIPQPPQPDNLHPARSNDIY